MAYKALGFVVWKVARIALRRRYGRVVPSRRAALGGLAGVLLLGAAGVAIARGSDR